MGDFDSFLRYLSVTISKKIPSTLSGNDYYGKEGFVRAVSFLQTVNGQDSDPMKLEYLLPIIAGAMLKNGVHFTVFPSKERWFGITLSKEDKPAVVKNFKKLYKNGIYREELYSDL